MKSLKCVVIGNGSILDVVIEASKSVRQLKYVIKEMIPSIIECDAYDLTLCLAKKGGNWLNSKEPDAIKLKKGELPEEVNDILQADENLMDKASRLDAARFGFPDEADIGEGDIHVLVDLPDRPLARPATKEPHPDRKRRWETLNKVLDENPHKKMRHGQNSTGCSYVSFSDVEEAMAVVPYDQPTKSIPQDKFNALYSYIMAATTVFDNLERANEATRVHLIAPVLVSVCALLNDATLAAEETVAGQRVHADGRFEFVIRRGDKRVCIVEAKKVDIFHGLAQAFVGSEALADSQGVPIVYNIVTTFDEWYFSKVTSSKVERDRVEVEYSVNHPPRAPRGIMSMELNRKWPTRDSIKAVAEKIYGMLSEDIYRIPCLPVPTIFPHRAVP